MPLETRIATGVASIAPSSVRLTGFSGSELATPVLSATSISGLPLHIAHRQVPAVQVDLQRRFLEHLAEPAATADELHAQRLDGCVEVLARS